MKKIVVAWILLIALLPLCFLGEISAKDVKGTTGHVRFYKGSAIPDPALQRAVGILDKGKLKTSTSNYGIFTGFGFGDTPYPEGLWGQYQYISMISLLFGVPGKSEKGKGTSINDTTGHYPWAIGTKYMYSPEIKDFTEIGDANYYWGPTASESFMDRTNGHLLIDWDAVEDAAERLHGTATAGEIYGGVWTQPDDPMPLIATSDVPSSWPITIDSLGNETTYWPGRWATTKTQSGEDSVMVGQFVSDGDVYFEFDDRLASRDVDPPGRLQGYPIGITAKVSGYSYGASVAEDIIFFNMYLYNTSPYHYERCYGGFYFDVDSYHRTYSGSYSGRTNDDDMMSFNTDWDFAYIWDLDDNSSGATNLAYAALKLLETPKATEPVDLDGDGIPDIQVGESLGLTDWHWFDWYYRPGADDGGLQGPFTGDGETPTAPDAEAIIYKVMAGDTSGTDSYGYYIDSQGDTVYFDRRGYNKEHYFHGITEETLNPHFDSYEQLRQDYQNGLDCVFIMSSGPFDFAPGDSIPFSFAVIMGQDSTDLVVNAKIAQLMYDNNYRGPTPPTAPNVTVLEEDQKITLFWDDVSINSRDALTKIKDFEGFRIYKSTDNGMTWGEKRIDDSTGVEYYLPIAQFDLDNEIRGHDPIAPHRFLGNNTGLQFQYTDEDVRNGQEYLYAVCAYDRGFIGLDPIRDSLAVHAPDTFTFHAASLENFLSNSTRLPHIVRAIPHRSPSNVDTAGVQITRLDSTVGNGEFKITVVDQKLITGHEYLILFHADMSTGVPKNPTFDLIDMTSGDTLLKESDQFIKLDPTAKFKTIPPRIDGLEWTIKSATQTQINQDGIEWIGQCNYDVTVNFSNRVVSDYFVVFVGEDAEDVYSLKRVGMKFVPDTGNVQFKVPFQIWNRLTEENGQIVPRKVTLTVFDNPFNPTIFSWESDVLFKIYENHLVGLPTDSTVQTINVTFSWSDTAYIDPITKQKIPPHRKWAVGDTLVIPVYNPFQEGDGFVVKTDKIYQVRETRDDDLKMVKVVPNPYIVRAGWEFDEYNRKIQFTNLPSKCTIYIFNVAGELVQTLYHDDLYDGSENWNLWTSNRQEVAPGLYIWVVKTPDGKKEMGKFTIIR